MNPNNIINRTKFPPIVFKYPGRFNPYSPYYLHLHALCFVADFVRYATEHVPQNIFEPQPQPQPQPQPRPQTELLPTVTLYHLFNVWMRDVHLVPVSKPIVPYRAFAFLLKNIFEEEHDISPLKFRRVSRKQIACVILPNTETLQNLLAGSFPSMSQKTKSLLESIEKALEHEKVFNKNKDK